LLGGDERKNKFLAGGYNDKLNIMKAKSIQGKSAQEIENKLADIIRDGFKPTLAFIFISSKDAIPKLQRLLTDKNIAVFGATTYCHFSENGNETEGSTLLFLDINPEYFKVVLKNEKKSAPEQWAKEIGDTALKTFSKPAFIISQASLTIPSNAIIEGLTEKTGSGVTIAGGIAGEHLHYSSVVFTHNQISDYGLLALIIDEEKIDIKGEAVSGWKPVGTEKTITQSEGRRIVTIDNQPAFDVVKKYIGDDIVDVAEEYGQTETSVRINTSYPLQVKRAGYSPLLIAMTEYNPKDGSVLSTAALPAGTTFRFSLPPDFEITETVAETSRQIKEKELPDADAMIVFSCIGRYMMLGPMASIEVDGLAKTWEKPTVGFYSLGEFGKVNGGKQAEFHGSTCSWVALKEK
jgi:hypothetical protein